MSSDANLYRNGATAAAHGSARGGALDALRFVASLLIVLYHFDSEGPIDLNRLHPVFTRGYLATDFFLMLSGFVLGRAYGAQVLSRNVGSLQFWLRRATRVWPAHLLILAAMASLTLAAAMFGVSPHHPQYFQWAALPLQALLVHAWGVDGGQGWNLPSWSLSALILCYAAFPALWRQVSRLPAPLLIVVGLTSVMLGDALCRALFGRAIYDLPFQFGVVRALPLFLLGMCLARSVEEGQPPIAATGALLWLSGGVLVAVQIAGRFDVISITAIAGVILALGRRPVGKPSRIALEGAQLSFALFITHILTGMIWFQFVRAMEAHFHWGFMAQLVLWLMAFPVAVLVALAFHRYVDSPLQEWLKPLLRTARGGATAEPMTPATTRN